MLKEAILNNKSIVITLLIASIILGNVTIGNYFETKELKAKMLEKSDEEVLITNIKLSKETIKDLESLLKNTENKIKTETKKETCLKQQLDRLVEWLEYNLTYCENKDNLSKFDEGL